MKLPIAREAIKLLFNVPLLKFDTYRLPLFFFGQFIKYILFKYCIHYFQY